VLPDGLIGETGYECIFGKLTLNNVSYQKINSFKLLRDNL
jgi:hypothetical protein